jgi:hypothetical protein
MRTICHAHLVLLDFITRIIISEQYYAAPHNVLIWTSPTDGPEDSSTGRLFTRRPRVEQLSVGETSSHKTNFIVFIYSETWTLHSMNLHYLLLQSCFDRSHQNFHKNNVEFSCHKRMFVLAIHLLDYTFKLRITSPGAVF